MLSLAVPGAPFEVLVVGSYVVWQPPSEPNGVITGYEIRIKRGSGVNVLSNISPTTFVREIQSSEIPSGTGSTTVEVRHCSILC